MKWICLISFMVIISACNTDRGSDCLERLHNDYPKYKYFAVIPKSLCKSCGATYPADLKNAYGSGKLGLVFNCEKQDITSIHYHLRDFYPQHLIIDTLLQYVVCDSLPESIYPAIVYVKNNKISVEYYNKDNVKAYEKLKREVLD